MLVPRQLHDDLGRDAGMGKFGDEAPAATMAGCAVDPCPAVKLSEQLAKCVGRERTALLAEEQSGLGGG